MNTGSLTRRIFAGRLAGLFSVVGMGAALTTGARAEAKNSVRKLGSDGKPSDPKDFITPIVIHNDLIYVAGQGAHDSEGFLIGEALADHFLVARFKNMEWQGSAGQQYRFQWEQREKSHAISIRRGGITSIVRHHSGVILTWQAVEHKNAAWNSTAR